MGAGDGCYHEIDKNEPQQTIKYTHRQEKSLFIYKLLAIIYQLYSIILNPFKNGVILLWVNKFVVSVIIQDVCTLSWDKARHDTLEPLSF